jgi:aminocarboxymuconate-semialdehyde decarboxylase
VGKFWFDSLVHDEKMLRFLVDFAGANRVALGSDYPFPLGENVPGAMIKQTDYSNEAKAQLLHGAALEWLQMNKANFI